MMSQKTVAVIQSNYIPWKGYFDIIHDADLFIFYDDIQYTKNDWRNRNKIKTDRGMMWLTIPVGTSLNRLICEVEIEDRRWAKKHWHSLKQWYGSAPYFHEYEPFLEEFYLRKTHRSLSDLNRQLIVSISREFLGISTEFDDSCNFRLEGNKLERLICLLKKAGAARYISGPSAREYIDETRFKETGIELIYKDYSGYPEYPQLHPPFRHDVSILDLLFNAGPEAPLYIWGWREENRTGRRFHCPN
ncbi:MAG: WbqC family protein [bacterium]